MSVSFSPFRLSVRDDVLRKLIGPKTVSESVSCHAWKSPRTGGSVDNAREGLGGEES